MARIRTIKPEFFTSSDTMDLSPHARLLYIGLWCEADREGRLAWRPPSLKVRYLPNDDCDIAAVCGELVAARLVVLYGDGLAYLPTFTKHQVINGRESDSSLPAPDTARVADSSSRVDDSEARDTDASRRKEGREGKGTEGKGREGNGAAVAAFPAPVSLATDAWQETIADWNRATRDVKELPAVSTAPASSKRIVSALKRCPDLALWQRRYERVAASAFCRGTNDRGWTADLWWTLEHGDEIDAGRYDDRAPASSAPGTPKKPGRWAIDIDAEVARQREAAAARGRVS